MPVCLSIALLCYLCSCLNMKPLIFLILLYAINIESLILNNSKDKDEGKSSLAFVFDTTGSMSNDLKQLREGAEMILKTALEESNIIADFVFVPFHDPNIGPATVTKNKQVFKAALNIIHVKGGGDCPEKSLSGVLLALSVSRPRSYVYVFTDASASDYKIVGKVLDVVQRKQSQVVFVLTGHCNDLKRQTYKVYQQVATASSGQVFNLNKTNVHNVLDFVRSSIRGRSVNLGSAVHPGGYNYTQAIPVDSSLGEVTVSVSGAKPTIKVVNPSGHEVLGPPQLVTTLDLSEIMIVKVLDPEPGNWTITVGSEKDYSVKVSGLSNITFDHGFSVEKTNSMDEASYRPLQGTYNHMLLSITPEVPIEINFAEILTTDGKTLFEVPVKRMDDMFLADAFIPPDGFFYIAINGRDENGQEFRRVGPTAVQAKPPDVPYLTAPKQIEGRSHDRVVLKCNVESLVPVSVQWTRDSPRMERKTSSLQSTSIEYVIEDMNEADVGTYRCSASNAAGHSKTNTQLSLLVEPPQVSVLPVNATLSAGEDLTVSCAVFSEAVLLKSQILFDNGNTVNVTNIKVGRNIDGFYSYNKTISNVTEKHRGQYTCLAANRGGSTNQSTYILIESEPTAKILGAHNLAGQIDTKLQLLCQVENANLAQWMSPDGTLVQEVAINGTYNISLDVTVSEEGYWTCIGLRNSHRASDIVQVNIEIKPEVNVDVRNITIVQGSIQQLVCTARGKPPPTIVWQRGTEQINNTVVQVKETVYRSVLTLDSDRETVNGTYLCIAENSLGTAQDTVIVNVRKKMRILENFTDQQVELYSQIDLHCNVDTLPPATVTWQHNNTHIQTDDTDISEDGTTLYIQKIDFKHLGLYTCIMDNGYERIQINGTLQVVGLENPELSKEPSRITARRGDTAFISCSLLKGNPEPKITWQYKNNETEEFQYLRNNMKVNEEGFEVSIHNASRQDEGFYQCIAENAIGKDNYQLFLNIQYPPELKYSKQNGSNQLEIKSGEKVVLSCNAVGNPQPIVVWTKEGKPISYSRNIYLNDANEVVIENATVYNAGAYSCNASSALGAVTNNYTLQVYMSPTIMSSQPEQAIEVLEGELVELPCAASGAPAPAVSWSHNNHLTDHRKYIDQYGLRFVANLTDFGEYSCVATNAYGKAILNYTVYVWVAPYLEPPLLETKNIVSGSNVTLQCSATGFPVPVILWQFNDNLLTENTTDLSSNDIGQLNITNARNKHEGHYECVAENLAGFAVKTFILNINEPPKIIEDNYTGPYIATVLDTSLTVACKATGKPTPYVVWIKDGYYLDKDFRYDIDVDGTLTIKSPSEDLSGDYTCLAKNSVGTASRTVPVQIYSVPSMMSEEAESVVHVVEGSNATIECPLRLGLNDTLKWYKDAVLISTGPLYLYPVRRTHGARYACVVSNMAGGAHAALAVDVQWPPHAHQNAVMLEIVAGDDAVLDCQVDAKPAAKTKWLFNSKLLLGEDESRLKLRNVKLQQTGVYKCVAANEHGTVVKEFTLDVLVPPFISEFDVLDVQLKEGTNATLECNARGSPKPDIKWIFNNTSWLIKNSTIISTNITAESEGTYKCIATNKAGTTSLVYRVNVVQVARVENIVVFNGTVGTNVIDKLEVVLGSYIRIACKGAGKPIPNIQWIRYGNTVSNNTANISYADLIIKEVAKSDSGWYVCVTSNEGGVDERKMKLDVLEPPKIFQNLFQEKSLTNIINLEVLSGQAFYMHCHPYGNPLPEIYWFKDDMPLKLFDNTMISTDYNEIIQSPNAKYEQTGNYTCIAKNKVGETGLVYLVDVLVPPPQPKESTKVLRTRMGKALNLTCPVEGAPRPYVMWIKHPYMEISENTPRVQLSEDNVTLVINDTLVTDSGLYSCIMTNKVGATEVNFNVIIEKPASIVGNVGNNTTESHVVALQRSIVLQCDVDGHPPPKITWLKDIQRVSASEAHIQAVLGSSLLAVWSARGQHAGQYICVAENSAGTASRRYNIAVKVPGKWSVWSQWSYCNVTCGLGYQTRSRFCHYIDDNNNTIDKNSATDKIILDESACKGSIIDKRKCHMPSCEEEQSAWSAWSAWSRWGACSATCGAATQARARRCRARLCAGDNLQIRKCPNLPKCSPQSRHENEVYISQENNETNLTSYLPETTIEMQPDELDYRKSLDPEEIYIPSGKKSQMYFDVNVTENLDRSERGPCSAGFRYNATDKSCKDVDECEIDSNQCHATQVCSNTAGGYRCSCPAGYAARAAGLRCIDVNECEQEVHGCEFACVNVAGGYVCACPRHLRLHLDRHHCVLPPLYKKPLAIYENSVSDEYSTDVDFPDRYAKYTRY
ncbi:PREDICTED: hemicentin-1-like isoform X2 [Papilio polytes]|uniref:hemicentin-1-like isoform X2 n=1 Tax=Papilio polytes TaxID=76194 RepID=UPI0006765A7A|nr:PREDICTED: hemicentin-1-like isoform X2 [Papilio polytes]